MILPGKLCLLAVITPFAASVAKAADQIDFGGFMLGGPFEAAQQHALEQEWKLEPFSDGLPGWWIVWEENLSFFVCNGVVASAARQLDGDLEEFTALVFTMHIKLGEPEIKITSLRAGRETLSTIDAHFDTDTGRATVQLQSIGGKRTFSISQGSGVKCN